MANNIVFRLSCNYCINIVDENQRGVITNDNLLRIIMQNMNDFV